MDKILRIIKNAFCVIVAGLFLFIAVVTICGAKGYSIASNSMNPNLSKGDVVFVKETPFEKLKEGDIVTVEFKVKDGQIIYVKLYKSVRVNVVTGEILD